MTTGERGIEEEVGGSGGNFASWSQFECSSNTVFENDIEVIINFLVGMA